jgi:CBS domain-containing protein
MTVSRIIAAKGSYIFTTQPHRTLLEVVKILVEKRIGAVVVTGADGSLKGIVSERDIVRAIARTGGAALEEPVSRHMTVDVITCQETDLISDVMSEMTRGGFRHMPVVCGAGKLTGMVSIRDVVKQRIAETEAESQSLRDYIQMAS